MIPKRAFCYWEGPPMSPLRQRSVETFRKQNPGWDVEVLCAEPGWREDLSVAQRSDLFRYQELAERGGVYFDTDIVFRRPIPEEWLADDVWVTLDRMCPECEGFYSIGLLASSPQNIFWEHAAKYVELLWLNGVTPANDYQAYGVTGLNAVFPRTVGELSDLYRGIRFRNVPYDAICPIPWDKTHRLWKPGDLPNGSIGLHWFGGSGDARMHELDPPAGSMVRRAAR